MYQYMEDVHNAWISIFLKLDRYDSTKFRYMHACMQCDGTSRSNCSCVFDLTSLENNNIAMG